MSERALTTTNNNERDPYLEYGSSEQNVVGRFLKFKDGDYLYQPPNEKKPTVIPVGTRLIADMPSLQRGWVRWRDKEPVDREMGLVFEAYQPPRRDDLGDNDKQLWETNNDGSLRDPWQKTDQLVLRSVDDPTDDDAAFTFATSSWGGRRAVRDLCKVYGKERRARPGQLPVVQLDVDSFMHEDYGRIKRPKFVVTGWTDGSPEATNNNGGADDVPF
jgi:hypothetical protein